MAPILVITQWQTKSKQARQSIIESLTKVAKYAEENEPDVLRYAITTPRTEDETSVFVIEE